MRTEMTRRQLLSMGAGLGLSASLPLQATEPTLRLAAVLGDHMVLQRNQPIRIWGWAQPGAVVHASLARRHARTVAGRDGKFLLRLQALPAGGPHVLSVRTDTTERVLHDVLVGEVWLCSGQSNMEWALRDSDGAAEAIASADAHATIRHIKLPHHAALAPQDDVLPASWQVCSAATAGEFSAVAWFFARRLQQALNVPVGLVNSSWGGSHLETWTSPQAALRDPDLAPIMQDMPHNTAGFGRVYRERMTAIAQRWHAAALRQPEPAGHAWASPDLNDSDWPTLKVPMVWEEQGLEGFDGIVWYRRTVELSAEQAQGGATLVLGTIDDGDETFVNGQRVGGLPDWDAQRNYAVAPGVLKPGPNVIAVRVTDSGGDGGFYGETRPRLVTPAGDVDLSGLWRAQVAGLIEKSAPGHNDLPTLLFNGMVHPLKPMALGGVIWYQGESNVPRAARYVAAFQNLIKDWRQQFGQPALPFYWVQLAAFLPPDKNNLSGSPWAELRDAQRLALRLPHTGMAVATDVGNANDIHPRNKRAVGERLARLALNRHYRHPMADSGPVLRQARREGRSMRLQFGAVGEGLAVRDGRLELQGFAIAGADQRFVPARAVIEARDRVRVWSDAVPQPVAVRFGWLDNPEQANLVDSAGLPASPFKTDHGAWVTANGRFAP